MNRVRLYLVANALAMLLFVWSYSEYLTSNIRLESVAQQQVQCQIYMSDIESLKSSTASIVVVPENFDPSVPVANVVKAVGLFNENFSVSETGTGRVEGTDVRKWRVNIPESQLTLRQTVELIAKLADDETSFQVGSVRLETGRRAQSSSQTAGVERWQVDFRRVLYLKHSE